MTKHNLGEQIRGIMTFNNLDVRYFSSKLTCLFSNYPVSFPSSMEASSPDDNDDKHCPDEEKPPEPNNNCAIPPKARN